jgi:acetylornithine aminotransferase
MAKGMGNGFPVGGIIVSRDIPLTKNSLGTTFGGNPMACAACLAVLDVLVQEELMPRAMTLGQRLQDRLSQFPEVTDVRGRGLMIGLDLKSNSAPVRRTLLEQQRILVGSASSPETVRLLPPLNIEDSEIQIFLEGFEQALKSAQDGGTRS